MDKYIPFEDYQKLWEEQKTKMRIPLRCTVFDYMYSKEQLEKIINDHYNSPMPRFIRLIGAEGEINIHPEPKKKDA